MLRRTELADTLTSESGAGKGQDNSIESTKQDNSFFDSDILFINKTKVT